MTRDPRSKEAVVLKLLEEGDATLCLDARYEGVEVPREYADNPSLRLVLNLNFPHPIHVDEDGISANLAFNGRRFACYIPMGALWAAFEPKSMQGKMWPDSMPPEVQEGGAAEPEGKPAREAKTTPLKARQRSFKAVPDRQPQDQNETPAPRKRGHLRVVK